jgi:hypothetical protein
MIDELIALAQIIVMLVVITITITCTVVGAVKTISFISEQVCNPIKAEVQDER